VDGLSDEVTPVAVPVAPGTSGKTISSGEIVAPGGMTVSGPTTMGAGVDGETTGVVGVDDVGGVAGVGVGLGVGVGVELSTGAQVELLTVLLSRVTAPVRARSLPSTVAPVVAVIEASARMLPLNCVPVPRVAELPTCQKRLQVPPLMNSTLLLEAVTRVDPIWNTKTESGLPWVLSVRVPVRKADESKQ
jgi:hypothetical protein